jgi:Protein of unknown function (DUF2510)/PASTA domain
MAIRCPQHQGMGRRKTGIMTSQAGWYPQPDGQQRYWDGESWTENFAPGVTPDTPTEVLPETPTGVFPETPTGVPSETHPPAARKNWFLRHKILTAIGAVLLLGIISSLANGGGTKSDRVAAIDQVATSTAPAQSAAEKAAADQAVIDKAAADKAAAAQAVVDQAAADKAAAAQAVIDKAAADKAAAAQAVVDKAAADKAAADLAASSAPEVFKMPNVVGQNLQLSQDQLQALGSYLMDQTDAAGLSRVQVLDSNWQVCAQSPAPGKTVPVDTMVVLSSVKLAEQCP